MRRSTGIAPFRSTRRVIPLRFRRTNRSGFVSFVPARLPVTRYLSITASSFVLLSGSFSLAPSVPSSSLRFYTSLSLSRSLCHPLSFTAIGLVPPAFLLLSFYLSAYSGYFLLAVARFVRHDIPNYITRVPSLSTCWHFSHSRFTSRLLFHYLALPAKP